MTCVHPSSFSLGVSCWFSEVSVGIIAAMTGEGVAVVVVVFVVVVMIVGFEGSFSKSGRFYCKTNIAVSCPQL